MFRNIVNDPNIQRLTVGIGLMLTSLQGAQSTSLFIQVSTIAMGATAVGLVFYSVYDMAREDREVNARLAQLQALDNRLNGPNGFGFFLQAVQRAANPMVDAAQNLRRRFGGPGGDAAAPAA